MPSHAVFNTPLQVNPTFEEVPTPNDYFAYAGEKGIGKTIKVWKVQTKKHPEIDPGLVSSPFGFLDSPDTEIISSGLNSKGPDSVALGRHGNFFLWGFSASPSDMTPEARRCFVNAVCYIRRFDGQRPIVRRVGIDGRDELLWYAYFLRNVLDEGAFRRWSPKAIRDDAEHYARFRKSVMSGFESAFSEDLYRRFGRDPEKYIAYYKENFEYLRFNTDDLRDRKPIVDEDAKGLGLSNRKLELLDRCVSMLERDDRPSLALRLLKRYTTEDFAAAEDWRSWLERNRGRLFFTEVGGYKFMVAPESLARPSVATDRKKPDARDPVSFEATLAPARVGAGGELDLIIRVETAPTWHIYAAEGSGGPGIPTTLDLKLPEGVVTEGEWVHPEPVKGSDGQMVYEGAVEFRRRLRVGADVAPGMIEVGCEIGYQACDPSSCRPPARSALKARAEVSRGP